MNAEPCSFERAYEHAEPYPLAPERPQVSATPLMSGATLKGLPDKSDRYQLVSIELGNGHEGQGDSIGVVVPWSPPDAFEGVTSRHPYFVQRRIDDGRWRENAQAKSRAGHAIAFVMGWKSDPARKADRARIAKVMRHLVVNGALRVVDAPDARGNTRKWVEVGEWAVASPPGTRGGGQLWKVGVEACGPSQVGKTGLIWRATTTPETPSPEPVRSASDQS